MTRRIFILIGVYIGVILLFAYLRPEKTDWSPTFSPDEKIPFASKILFQELGIVRKEHIVKSDRPAFNVLPEFPPDSSSIYFCLNPSFLPGELDRQTLLEFVSRGNICFIASLNIDDELLDTLDVHVEYEYLPGLNTLEWYYEDNVSLTLESDPEAQYPAAVSSGYYWYVLEDSTDVVLGQVDEQHPCFVKCQFGKGTFYLHSFPFLFTNYHMLYQENHRGVSASLALIPEANTWVWDTYYLLPAGGRAQTPLAILNRHASFRWAYWLSIVGMVIFILFTARRRQRIIPVIFPKRNTTLDFVSTIGDLYFHRGDHMDLFRKKVNILQSQMEKKYRLRIVDFSDEDARQVALRASMDVVMVTALFAKVRLLQTKNTLAADSIFGLQRQLDHFLQRSKP